MQAKIKDTELSTGHFYFNKNHSTLLRLDNEVNFCIYSKIPSLSLKGTATLMISMLYMKDLSEPWILIPVSSKSIEKYGSYWRLNICKLTLMEAAIL